MGYRFVMEQAGFTPRIVNGDLRVALAEKRRVAPFYDWPLKVYLLDSDTRAPVWSDAFGGVDIREWLGGEDWTSPDWVPVDHWSQNVVENNWADVALGWGTPPPASD